MRLGRKIVGEREGYYRGEFRSQVIAGTIYKDILQYEQCTTDHCTVMIFYIKLVIMDSYAGKHYTDIVIRNNGVTPVVVLASVRQSISVVIHYYRRCATSTGPAVAHRAMVSSQWSCWGRRGYKALCCGL